MRSTQKYLALLAAGISLLAACEKERPPRSVDEFVANPIMLEAAMVRCAENRDATRYDAECVAARQASQLIEARDDAARRAEQESRSELKRQAFRRTQEAAAQARERAAEADRMRKEAEYLAQFGVAPPRADQVPNDEALSGNTPVAVIPSSTSEPAATSNGDDASVGANATEEEDPKTDLESIRNELQRRNDESGE